MKINVYTKYNGVGLQADAELLRSILTEHDVVIIDWERPLIRLADVGIHLEHIRIELRKLACIIFQYLTLNGLSLIG
jgi:hypothetical protein